MQCISMEALGHSRCEYGEGDDYSDEKSAYSGHDAVQVAPPVGFLKGFVNDWAELAIEALLDV